jgi:hypothetical protein
MAYKEDWFEDAGYTYGNRVYLDSAGEIQNDRQTTVITFSFPKATTPNYTFTDILYRHDQEGNIIYQNETALMLQCYIDKYHTDKKEAQ